MTILIGTDEAGYGPNLGPLVISTSVWRVPDGTDDAQLYDLLRHTVRPAADSDEHLPIADSKQLYAPGRGLALLEQAVLKAVATLGHSPRTWQAIWPVLAPCAAASFGDIAWYAGFDRPLPVDSSADLLDRWQLRFTEGLQAAGVELLGLQSFVSCAARFNRLLEAHDSKGAALSHETLQLVARALANPVNEPVVVRCDKHGGRNHYAAILHTIFPGQLVQTVRESRECSIYRWGPKKRRIEFRFVTQGERFLPTALASMASKYLRELAMLAFNPYWLGHVPGLQPTAGYPSDAGRFRRDIEAARERLGIAEADLWRRK